MEPPEKSMRDYTSEVSVQEKNSRLLTFKYKK